jgi:serine/threonine-protein kinase
VKILDFGLAKITESEPTAPGADASRSPTVTKDTALGVILGTASYMSPEQARGKSVDRRTDIWAFGCCCFEALTGEKAFPGETVTDILAGIVKNDPRVEKLPPGLPRTLVDKCLRKDVRKRLQHIGDGRIALEEEPTLAGEKRRPSSLGWALLGALSGGLLVGLAAWALTRGQDVPEDVRRLTVTASPGVVLRKSPDYPRPKLALSPDGSKLAFVGEREGSWELYLRPLDRFEAALLPGTLGADMPFFSPDSEWVGFVAEGKLKKVSLADGQVVELARLSSLPWGASWSEDGVVFVAAQEGLIGISENGEELRRLTDVSDGLHPQWPAVVPGGRFVLFSEFRKGIHFLSRETGRSTLLVPNGEQPQVLSNGHILFERERTLFVVPFDARTLEITGEPRGTSERVYERQAAVSAEGTLAYVADIAERGRELVWVDRAGAATRLTDVRHLYNFRPVLSPDGRALAVTIEDSPGRRGPEVWTYDLERNTFARVTVSGDGVSIRPLWSPDGRRIYFDSNRSGGYRPFVQAADGTGQASSLVEEGGGSIRGRSISADGSLLVLTETNEKTGSDIVMLRLDGESELAPLLTSEFDERDARLSPDDRLLAYVSDESGRDDVYVVRFPSLEGRTRISASGGVEPVWSRDGRELFYLEGNRVVSVAVIEGRYGRPETLFELDRAPSSGFDVSPDGKRFLMIKDEASLLTEIQIVLNWDPEKEGLR